jgi:hypothetical protein
MRKPILLVALKAAVILYFAACANVEDYSFYKMVTPVVTKGSWKVNLYMDANLNKTNDFSGYTFSFNSNGDVAVTKNGNTSNGHWYEDNISQRVIIDLGTADPLLSSLNDTWNVSEVSNSNISMQSENSPTNETLVFTNQ